VTARSRTKYLFDDGIPDHWHAEWQLRRAIKQTVANAGHEDLLLDPCDRAFRQALSFPHAKGRAQHGVELHPVLSFSSSNCKWVP
jgi:hypothetical protein